MFPNRHSARRARAGPGKGPSARGPTSDNGPVIGSYPMLKTSGRGGCPDASIIRASTLTGAPGRHRRLDEAP